MPYSEGSNSRSALAPAARSRDASPGCAPSRQLDGNSRSRLLTFCRISMGGAKNPGSATLYSTALLLNSSKRLGSSGALGTMVMVLRKSELLDPLVRISMTGGMRGVRWVGRGVWLGEESGERSAMRSRVKEG